MFNRIVPTSFVLSIALSASALAQDARTVSQIDRAMFFDSKPNDVAACDMWVADDGSFQFPKEISSPAATCPDAMSWKGFIEAIQAEFWKSWASERQMFPAEPLAMCDAKGANPKACCDPASLTNPGYDGEHPGIHCPFFPGDHPDYVDTVASPNVKLGDTHGTFASSLEPGLIIKERMVTLVVRNKPFFDYAFSNYLYSQNGLAGRFRRAQVSAGTIAPFRRPTDQIDFPLGSVMVKSDWLHQDDMLRLGLIQTTDKDGNRLDPPQNPDFPYVTMMITDADRSDDPGTFTPGLHYLVAITVADKELPQWLWYAMEHVGNLGRCDFTGCNDSFGFRNESAPGGTYDNFIPPHTKSDLGGEGEIFDLGKSYSSGKISRSLAAVFDKAGITDGSVSDPKMPSPADPAWRSYRLKGSQTRFVSDEGHPTAAGHSVAEAGFVNTSSCLTCHTQASVDGDGQLAIPRFGLALKLNLFGYQESSTGAPDLDWFYRPGGNTYIGFRTDFVWGVRYAKKEIAPKDITADRK